MRQNYEQELKDAKRREMYLKMALLSLAGSGAAYAATKKLPKFLNQAGQVAEQAPPPQVAQAAQVAQQVDLPTMHGPSGTIIKRNV